MRKIFSFMILMLLTAQAGATLNPGYIPVDKTGGSSPTVQNATLYDTGSASGPGNVGVGTTNPQATLDVNGLTRTSSLLLTAIPGTQCLESVSGIVFGSGSACGSGGGGGGGITFYDGVHTVSGTTQLNITGGTISGTSPTANLTINPQFWILSPGNVGIDTFQNVGIGTISPQFTLQVTGQAQVSNGIQLGSGGATFTGSNGNVGLGSTSPVKTLDVAGTVRMTGFQMTSGISSGYVLTSDSSGNGTWQAATGGGGSGNVGVGTTGYLPQYIGVGTLGISNIIHVGVNVGIGSLTPEYGLVVAANGAKILGNAGVTATSNFLTNVGIGSTAPGGSLDVAGGSICLGHVCDSTWPSGGGGNGNVGIGTANWIPYYAANGSTVVANNDINLNGSNVGVGSSYPGQALDVNGTVRSLNFISTGSGTSDFKSNVGIGSVTPGQALDINGTARMTGIILPGGAQGQVIMQNSVGIGTWSTYSSGGGSGTVTSITALSPLSGGAITTSGSIGIGTALGSISTFGATGNIGISSTNPGQMLDVQGTTRTTGFTLNLAPLANGNIMVGSNLGVGTWMPSSTLPGQITTFTTTGSSGAATYTSSTGTLNIPQYSGTNYWSLQTSGNIGISTIQNVGIGTSFVGGTNEGALSVMNGNVGIGTWLPAYSLDNIGTTRALQFIATSSGQTNFGTNVGIGTTLTTNSLDVAGNVGIGTTYAGYVGAPSNSLIVSGDVGIGTWVPTGSLEVEGGNVGIGTAVSPDIVTVQGSLIVRGNLAGGVTGNIGIGTTQTASGATCDSSCNTAGKRCFGGIPSTGGFDPCSTSIIGDCICLPAT